MSFGFMGIQFGWGLQMANMSSIYEYLHAKPDELPQLWLAAPLTGLIMQPIIGHMSDRTWGRLGRRKPYFLTGAILSSLALIFMPNSPSLWMAAGLLWILDASINITMEPFRAFVSDLLPEEQRTHGFVMQSLFIGFGSIVASSLPWMMTHWFHVSNATSDAAKIPATVRYSFYIGAVAFFCAVLWTILRTREYPPANMTAFEKMKADKSGFVHGANEVIKAIVQMPATMKQLAWVQVFTWLGLFCMWLYLSVAIAHNVFGAPDETSPLYAQGIEWGGLCSSMYSVVGFAFSFALVGLTKTFKRKTIHTCCLICGALGLMSVAVIHNKYLLFLSMTGVGIAWASILSLPYAILASSLPPERTGVYMGIFNSFIVLPEIANCLTFGWIMKHLLNNNRLAAVVAGGVFMLLAAILMQRVRDVPAGQPTAST